MSEPLPKDSITPAWTAGMKIPGIALPGHFRYETNPGPPLEGPQFQADPAVMVLPGHIPVENHRRFGSLRDGFPVDHLRLSNVDAGGKFPHHPADNDFQMKLSHT